MSTIERPEHPPDEQRDYSRGVVMSKAGIESLPQAIELPGTERRPATADGMPLLGAQRQLWVGQQLDSNSPAFNTGGYISLKGPLDLTLFQRAASACIAETEALRLRFLLDAYGPYQMMMPQSAVSLKLVDMSHELVPAEAAMAWMQHEMDATLDLAEGKTFSWTLLRLSPEHSLFCVIYHHLVIDGLSSILLVRRVRQLYHAARNGMVPKPYHSASMSSLVEADEAYTSSKSFADDRLYWSEKLAQCPPMLTLSKARGHTKSWKSGCESIWMETNIADALVELAGRMKTSLPRLLMGALGIIVHRLSGSPDFLMGMVVTGRGGRFRNIPANLTHVLPLRFRLQDGMSFKEAVGQAALEMEGANSHKLYQIDDIRQDLGLRPNHPSLFGIEINIMPFFFSESEDGLQWSTRSLSLGPVADLCISIRDRDEDGRLQIDFNGNKDLYTNAELAAIASRFEKLLVDLSSRPVEATLGEVSAIDTEERLMVTETFNQTTAGTQPMCLPELFEAQAARTPEATALIFESRRFTYAELDAAANRVARLLMANGIGSECVVALLVPRSPELLIAMLGIVKAGAAYLPMDADHPAARIQYMVQDSGARLLVTTAAVRERTPLAADLPVLLIDDDETSKKLAALPEYPVSDAERKQPIHPENLLYTIYTSGSTGLPKGVAIEHRSFTVFLKAMLPQMPMQPGETLLAITTLSFDIAGLEMFFPLIQGACVMMLNGADSRDPHCVAAAAREFSVDVVQATPTFWRALLLCDMPRTVRVLVGGEALPVDLVTPLLEFKDAINLYGPTETTVWSSCHRITPEDVANGAVVTIGRPLNEQKFYILDEALKPVPVGAIGELYIAGAGLARGYLNRPELTQERFVPCPFGEAADRMYRTGDLARWRVDGLVDFLGRADQQVKIRGFRIEPGEIEAALAKSVSAIKECAVVPRELKGETQLVAYYTMIAGERAPDTREMRTALMQSLPDYMVPAIFMRIEKMPLTPNAKLDRRALPQPDPEEGKAAFVPPRGTVEATICRVFAEFTKTAKVGRDDDFFQLGGRSLAAVLCVHRLRRELGVNVSLRQLFEAPSAASLAVVIAGSRNVDDQANNMQHDARPLIFLLPGVGGDEPRLVRFRTECEASARMVTLDYPDWTLMNDRENSVTTLIGFVARQIEAKAPVGPIWLMGYSFGGYCAHLVAMHLTQAGREVVFVGLLDTSALPATQVTLSAQMQDIVSPITGIWYSMQDVGRVLRSVKQRDTGRILALTTVRWLTSPLGRGVLPLAVRIRQVQFKKLRLPFRFSYHLHFYFNESYRGRIALRHWRNIVDAVKDPMAVPAYLFRSEDHLAEEPEKLGWEEHFQPVRVINITGTHATMFDPPHLKAICEKASGVITAHAKTVAERETVALGRQVS